MISIRALLATVGATSVLFGGNTWAFPPAPYHEIYGLVRDEQGNPLASGATVRLNGTSTTIVSQLTNADLGLGLNYSLKVPMDAGTLAQLYQNSALLSALPFTFEIDINGVTYVPIEVQGGMMTIGDPGERTRIDLTLGVDSDGDGLPDSWEAALIGALGGGLTLADIDGDGDTDGDGASNFLEYLAGTYAHDQRANFDLTIVELTDTIAKLRFLAVKGRSYQVSVSEEPKNFAPIPFSLNADGSGAANAYRADSTKFQDVYIPIADLDRVFFQLNVQ